MNMWNRGGGDRDPDGLRSVTVRQLVIRIFLRHNFRSNHLVGEGLTA